MRKFIVLTASAPLALLAACGDTTPADEIDAEPVDESAIVDDADVMAPDGDAAGATQADAGYAGSYTLNSDGGASTLTLNDDDTYSYTAPGEAERTGSYSWMDDGRLLIEDFDGQAGYFTLSDGDLYRLESADTPVDEITVEARYMRNRTATAPLGSTNSVQDKRN